MAYLIESEAANRLAQVREILETENLDLALVYYDEFNIGNGWYLTGWCPQFESGAVLIPRKGDPILLGGPESEPFAKQDSAIKNTRNFPVFMVPDEEYPNATIIDFPKLFAELNANLGKVTRIGLVGAGRMPVDCYNGIAEGFAGVEIVDITEKFLRLRYFKSAWEAEQIGKGFALADHAYKAMKDAVKVGASEIEIAAAGEIGAEIYQIDDSWQQGRSLAALSDNNLAVTMDFWKTDPERLPGGFMPLCKAAEKAGIKLGLWCAPSYPLMYRDHREFAEMLLDYHRQYGFATVKVDAVRIQSLESQENLEKLLREVRQKSGKKLFFNLDTTNGQRPGYFYFLEYGNIFLENRYCFLGGDEAVAYHPEKTLRNLWQLSAWVRPQTLQIEIPSPDDIPEKLRFKRDPRDYGFDYWCALALFANMLIWTSPSRCSSGTKAVLQKITALGKELRKEIFHSTITPVGAEPDGKSFTGFASDAKLWLIFREKNCPEETFTLPFDSGSVIAGCGKIEGTVLTMPPASWCVIRY